jgi:hypothetical protein
MATTPKSPPLSTGTTSPASRYTVTPTSTAALGAAQSAIKQATGTAPPSTFTVGSTMSVSQAAPGAKFTQGSTTTPVANKAAASSPAPKSTGTTQSNVLQSILGIAPLASVGLSVFNKVFQGTNFSSTITNNTNAPSTNSTNNVQDPAQRQQATPAVPSNGSTNNVQDPAQRQQAAAVVPSNGSTNNVQDPAQRAQAALAVDLPPSTGSTNNVQDPAQRAQIADQVATDNAKSISNVQDPAQRAQARDVVANYQAPATDETAAEAARLARTGNADANNYVENFAAPPADEFAGIDQQVAEQQLIDNNYVENFAAPPADEFAGIDAQIAANAADQAAIDQAKSISNVQDPAQRAQARDVVANYQAPAVDETDAETNRLVRANTAADIQVQNQKSAEVDELSAYPPGDNQLEDPNNYVENFDPPPTEIDELSAYPENPVDQKSAEIDELSAYPPGDNQLEDPNNYIENFDPPPTDEFDGIDAQIAENNYIENFDPPATNIDDAGDAEQVESDDPDIGGEDSNRTALRNAQAGQTEQVAQKFEGKQDWRVRLSLAPGSDYLYNVAQGEAGILNPLQATEGVIFPYTPSISVVYSAAYEASDITHTNYKFFSYKNSAVDTITITADFTAQDTAEAQYLLAVIHFFRSVTKMFYGQDQNPKRGTPPPLCYLRGLGAFQFNWHPLVINNFTYTLPTDVDYIRVMDTSSRPGVNVGSGQPKGKPGENPMAQRMAGANIQTGGLAAPPKFKNNGDQRLDQNAVTYVPTKMQITVTANPIVSRNDVSNNFSLADYATGAALAGGGFW